MTGDQVSSDMGPFAITPDWILRAPISDRAVRLFGLLARYADHETHEAFPARSTLATALRVSRDSVDRAIRELVRIGAVSIEARKSPEGDRTSNLYRLSYVNPQQGGSRKAEQGGGRKAAATVAAPVRHRTRTNVTRTSTEVLRNNEVLKKRTGVASDCARRRSQDETPTGTAILSFKVRGSRDWTLTEELLERWRGQFQGLDVLAECRKAQAWLEANPGRRKTSRGMREFLTSWLNRACDRPGVVVAPQGPSLPALRAPDGFDGVNWPALPKVRAPRIPTFRADPNGGPPIEVLEPERRPAFEYPATSPPRVRTGSDGAPIFEEQSA